jgi:hypothetical protein
MLKRLKGLEISEERDLAGQVAGLLYLTAAPTVAVMLVLPGVETRHWAVVLALAAVGAAWGLACLRVIPWRTAHPAVSHFSCFLGLPITAIGMAATGGAHSPARFYLFFIVVFCGYFYPPTCPS